MIKHILFIYLLACTAFAQNECGLNATPVNAASGTDSQGINHQNICVDFNGNLLFPRILPASNPFTATLFKGLFSPSNFITNVTFGSPSSLNFTQPAIGGSGGGAVYPFIESGNLLLAPRGNGATRDIVFFVGNPPQATWKMGRDALTYAGLAGTVIGFVPAQDLSAALDTGITRVNAGGLEVTTSASAPNSNGTLKTAALVAGGANAGLTGTGACNTFALQAGGGNAGTFQCTAATAASTVTITPNITAPNGWSCTAYDQTTRANLLQQTGNNQTTCTLTATSITQNDVIIFSATAF